MPYHQAIVVAATAISDRFFDALTHCDMVFAIGQILFDFFIDFTIYANLNIGYNFPSVIDSGICPPRRQATTAAEPFIR